MIISSFYFLMQPFIQFYLLITIPSFVHGTGKLQQHISGTETPGQKLQVLDSNRSNQQRPIPPMFDPHGSPSRTRSLFTDDHQVLPFDQFPSSSNIVKRDATLGIRIGLANGSLCTDFRMLSTNGAERVLHADHTALSHSGIALFETVCFIVDQSNEMQPSIRSCRVTSTNVSLSVEESLAIALDIERSTGIEANSVTDGIELQGTSSINQYEKLVRTVRYGTRKNVGSRYFKLVCEFYDASQTGDQTKTFQTNQLVVSVLPVDQHEDHPATTDKTSPPLDYVHKSAQHHGPEDSPEDDSNLAWLVPVALVLLSVIVCIAVFTAARCRRVHSRSSGVDLNVLNHSQSSRCNRTSNDYYVRANRSRLRSFVNFFGINFSRSTHSDTANLFDGDAIQNEAEDETQDSNWAIA